MAYDQANLKLVAISSDLQFWDYQTAEDTLAQVEANNGLPPPPPPANVYFGGTIAEQCLRTGNILQVTATDGKAIYHWQSVYKHPPDQPGSPILFKIATVDEFFYQPSSEAVEEGT